MRGYFGIGIYHTKKEQNIGTLYRSAHSLGASFIYTVGRRYKPQSSDTTKGYKSIPLYHYLDFNEFYKNIPYDCNLIGIELDEKSEPIRNFVHPERVAYILGAEDHGLPQNVLGKCKYIVKIPGKICHNVSVAGAIVMYDRIMKNGNSH